MASMNNRFIYCMTLSYIVPFGKRFLQSQTRGCPARVVSPPCRRSPGHIMGRYGHCSCSDLYDFVLYCSIWQALLAIPDAGLPCPCRLSTVSTFARTYNGEVWALLLFRSV